MNHAREQSIVHPTNNIIAGVVTKSAVSLEGRVLPEGSRAFRVDIKVSGVTVVGGINAILQHQTADLGWEDTKTIAITTNDVVSAKFLDTVAGDQTYLPLRGKVRVVCTTTNAGDKVTFDSIIISQ